MKKMRCKARRPLVQSPSGVVSQTNPGVRKEDFLPIWKPNEPWGTYNPTRKEGFLPIWRSPPNNLG